MDIQNLVNNCGDVIIPGTAAKLYLACSCDIETFPPYKTTIAVGDKVTLLGDIVLKPGKKFGEIDITLDMNEISHTLAGVRGSKNFTNKLDFETPKSKAADEWFDQNPNACLVGIIKQKDGSMRVLGSNVIPAFFDAAEGKGGKANGDAANWVVSLMDSTGRIAPYYEGVIDLAV